jgi:hypothetical protein
MVSMTLRILFIACLTLSLASCAAIEGIFKAGVGVGAALVILVVILLVGAWAMLRGGGSSTS